MKRLIGMIFKSVAVNDDGDLVFATEAQQFRLTHHQYCCESVYIKDIVGDLQDLVGSPLLLSEKVSNKEDPGRLPDSDEAYQWTFYKFATIKGYVDVSWYGSSNGYYSTGVTFEEFDAKGRTIYS